MSDTFRALVLEEADRKVSASVQDLDEAQLPDGDVTIAISYSTLNYKDGMILNGIGRLVRNYPHVPGIDFSGTVEASSSPDYAVGDKVVLTGWRVGEAHWGGYAEKARVKSDWLVPLPDGLTDKQAMALGTAGFTAMLAVMDLQDHGIEPDSGPVLVTGGNGGASAVIDLFGNEIPAAGLTIAPTWHDFGPEVAGAAAGTTAATQQFLVQNNTGGTVNFTNKGAEHFTIRDANGTGLNTQFERDRQRQRREVRTLRRRPGQRHVHVHGHG